MSARNAPLSPVSLGGSDWPASKYPNADDGSYFPGAGRANLASPPNSGGSNGTMSMNGFPSGPRSPGGPSPPPSIARSSHGTSLYGSTDPSVRNSTRPEMNEGVLQTHYGALKTFLHGRDPNPKASANRARDKLLRLSSVQFYELSTDVYDELVRRQAAARAPPNSPNGPPAFLVPQDSFHPKRNQARQRLSSLGPPRFRDLAADVFHELERRFPRFVGGEIPRGSSAMSMRGGPMSRTGTPVNGNGFPPRGQSRMRRPSDASSIRGPPPPDAYGIPPSPGLPPGEFGRPMPKQLNQNNTIVPNKSTMVEEDDGGTDGEDAFGLEGATNGKAGAANNSSSEADKKLIESLQSQMREMQDKLEGMEETIKKKDDELTTVLNDERTKASASNLEKKEWADMRLGLENALAEAQSLNDSMKEELSRVRKDHEDEKQLLKNQVEELQQNARNTDNTPGDAELQRENEDLRNSLRDQQQVTEEVRREAQEFLQEMRMLSQQSGSTYERHQELESAVEQLEQEVREWRNRYTKAKTQLRNMRSSSMGLGSEMDATKLIRDRGFMDEHGLVRDVHVTKFQISVDELLQRARHENPETVTDAMKSVVVSVRRIMRDLDESSTQDDEWQQQRGKLRAKVSATANSLITASKNFAAAAGISPVSLIDASAVNLSGAIVELLRIAKIRQTPAGELEDDDDGSVTPVESTGFFSPRSTTQASTTHDTLPPPPPFQGLGGMRASADSSAYSPVNSPRESIEPYSRGTSTGMTNGMANGMPNGMGYHEGSGHPMANGYGMAQQRSEDLKIYLEDQTAVLVSDIQNLVGSVRGDAEMRQISGQIRSISAIIGKVIDAAHAGHHGQLVAQLGAYRDRLLEADDRGRDIAQAGVRTTDRDWRLWSQTLPPIAFEIARETRELVQHVGRLATSTGDDDFS